jgi:hypothetical protein
MDAAAAAGVPVGDKTSSAYAPPELVRIKATQGRAGTLERAHGSFDVWSLGVILFELCAGRTLFAQDTSNDELVSAADITRLCVWHTITDEELEPVLMDAEAEARTKDAARNLIRWCLKGRAEDRPTVDEVLAHPFLGGDSVMKPLVMRYHGFLSHAQADASGTVAALYLLYKQFGLHTWIDMRQEVLTLEGMRQGVRDSSVFILVLSEHVLGSWFCQQEMLCAIEEQKPIQLIVEQEPRFNPFDIAAWLSANSRATCAELKASLSVLETAKTAAATVEDYKLALEKKQEIERVKLELEVIHTSAAGGRPGTRMTKTAAGKLQAVPPEICQMIDANLPNAVTYRRRDFEVDAMMRELCHRNGLVIPKPASVAWPANKPPLRVFVICASETADKMLSQLREALTRTNRILLTQEPEALATADRILLLLTAGVLQRRSLAQLVDTIQRDKAQQQDRIVAVYNAEAGWQFGCEEQKHSSKEVQDCLDNHEAVTYRAQDLDGPSRHEFPAMVTHLAAKLGAAGAAGDAPSGETPCTGADSAGVNITETEALQEREMRLLRTTHREALAVAQARLEALTLEVAETTQCLVVSQVENARLHEMVYSEEDELIYDAANVSRAVVSPGWTPAISRSTGEACYFNGSPDECTYKIPVASVLNVDGDSGRQPEPEVDNLRLNFGFEPEPELECDPQPQPQPDSHPLPLRDLQSEPELTRVVVTRSPTTTSDMVTENDREIRCLQATHRETLEAAQARLVALESELAETTKCLVASQAEHVRLQEVIFSQEATNDAVNLSHTLVSSGWTTAISRSTG